MSETVHILPGPAAGAAFRRIHEFIEAQVARTPDACALMHGETRLTYREMNDRADRLARHLQELGVGPEVIVGICLERSVGTILSVLAVLKAGGAYLPLDPAYPGDRLAYMLENSRCTLLITEPEIWQCRAAPGRTLSFRAFEVLHGEGIDGHPAQTEPPAAEDPLAYVIYTSGSTGRPKGVSVAHGSACHLIRWHSANMPVPAGARVIQLAPLSFDVSFQEIFGTLADGGTLVLIDESLRRDPHGLRNFLAEQRIARLFLTPVLLYRLAELAGPPLPDLHDVTAAGEQLRITPAVARFFFARHPGDPAQPVRTHGDHRHHALAHAHRTAGKLALASSARTHHRGGETAAARPRAAAGAPGPARGIVLWRTIRLARVSARSRTHGGGVSARPGRSRRGASTAVAISRSRTSTEPGSS